MKGHFVQAVAVAVWLVASVPAVFAADLGLVTGSEKGTYYQFGQDLRTLGSSHGFNLTVVPSRGSIENVQAVYQRPKIPLGIVQSDVLAFVAKVQTDPALKRIASKTRMVFPLYNEEVHVLGRADIKSFDDLADRRVAIGRELSGTYLTARLLFKLSEVRPREMVTIDTDEAVAQLKAGAIDAMFYVAGAPVRLFTDAVSAADGFALVPITNPSIHAFYVRTEIPAGTYAWQPAPVPTVAVKAVLISFDFRRDDCENVGRFARLVADQRTWLLENGHPKWKSVDLDAELRGWQQYDCVRKHLARAARAAKERP